MLVFILGVTLAILCEWGAVRVRRVAAKRTLAAAGTTATTATARTTAAATTTAAKANDVDGLTKLLHWGALALLLAAGFFWLSLTWPVINGLPNAAALVVVIVAIVAGIVLLIVAAVEIKKDLKPDRPAFFAGRLAATIIAITLVHWGVLWGVIGNQVEDTAAMVRDTKPITVPNNPRPTSVPK